MTETIILCDIDGVLADVRHLLPFISKHLPKEKRNYNEYYRRIGEAKPTAYIEYIAEMLFLKPLKFYYTTGRSEQCRNVTTHWLNENRLLLNASYSELLMRKDGDERPAHEVKLEMLNIIRAKHPEAYFLAIDDDSQVIKMYRREGVACFHIKSDEGRSE
jgi:hypothetical protein